MKALITNNNLLSRVANITLGKNLSGNRASWKDVPVPTISDNEILIKVRAVALNAADFKHIDAISPPGCIVGCDFVGEVPKVGHSTTKSWKIGDRVAGFVHGGLYPDRGAFAEFLKTDSDLVWKVPDEMDDAAATTYGVLAVTAMLALNARLGLPWADERFEPNQNSSAAARIIFIYAGSFSFTQDHFHLRRIIFIYAGSTCAGLFTIQLAKTAGYTVVATASPHSFDLVKTYGADAVFNYREPGVDEHILERYPNISVAVDCFSEGKSTEICDKVIGENGGKVITLLPTAKSKVQGIDNELIMAYTLFGRAFQWLPPVGPKFPANPPDREALVRFYSGLPKLTNILKPLPTILEVGGFDGIFSGLSKLREGKVSGGKLVVELWSY